MRVMRQGCYGLTVRAYNDQVFSYWVTCLFAQMEEMIKHLFGASAVFLSDGIDLETI